jgi:hypothetical protein
MSWPPDKGESFSFGEGDVAFADDEVRAAPALSAGGSFRAENLLRIPSLPERLGQLVDGGADLADPDMARLVPPDDVTRFCLHHGLEAERSLRLLRRETTYPTLVRAGLLQALWLNLLEYQEGDAERQTGVAIPVAELHCPPFPECQAAYEVESGRSRSAGLTLRVRGVGAGGGLTARLHFQDTIEVHAACGQVTVPGDIEVVPWIRPDDGARIDVVSVTAIAEGAWSLAAIPAGRTHFCGADARQLRDALDQEEGRGFIRQGEDFFPHTVAVPGAVRRHRELETTRSFSFGSELVELESQFTRQYGYSYDLGALGAYVGFFEDPRSEVFFWAWSVP